jgi:hypothetical protein
MREPALPRGSLKSRSTATCAMERPRVGRLLGVLLRSRSRMSALGVDIRAVGVARRETGVASRWGGGGRKLD